MKRVSSIPALAVTAACCLLAAAVTARAQSHPVFLPTRDVVVTYSLSGGQGGPSQRVHMYYDAAGRIMRIDTPGNAGYTVLDAANRRRTLVMNDQQGYATVPMEQGQEEGFVLNSSMNYRRTGSSSVAGIDCTEWAVSSQEATGTACVTADGILLRGSSDEQGGSTSLVATDVQYAPQPRSLFEPPASFRKLDPAQLAGPGGPPDGQPQDAPPPGYGQQGGAPYPGQNQGNYQGDYQGQGGGPGR